MKPREHLPNPQDGCRSCDDGRIVTGGFLEPVRTIQRTPSMNKQSSRWRTARPLTADDVRHYTFPYVTREDGTVKNTVGCPQKTTLNLLCPFAAILRVHTV